MSALRARRLCAKENQKIEKISSRLYAREGYARLKQLHEVEFPETKAGISQALGMNQAKENQTADSAVSFVKQTAAKTGKSERTIREDIQIAENISEDVRDSIRDSPVADNKKFFGNWLFTVKSSFCPILKNDFFLAGSGLFIALRRHRHLAQ